MKPRQKCLRRYLVQVYRLMIVFVYEQLGSYNTLIYVGGQFQECKYRDLLLHEPIIRQRDHEILQVRFLLFCEM